MKQYNCVIVDDEPIARDIIIAYSKHLPSLKIIATCSNALEAKQVLQNSEADILFLDINMPVLNGIAFLKTVRNPPQVIFTTAYREYAVDAFDLSAIDYLLKPFSMERFIVAVDKAIERINTTQSQQSQHTPVISRNDHSSGADPITRTDNNLRSEPIFLKADGKIYKLDPEEILFAEASGNYSKIVTKNFTIMPAMSFTSLASILEQESFIRVHRSFIINKNHIRLIEGNRVFIGTYEIPVGSSYKDDFVKTLGL